MSDCCLEPVDAQSQTPTPLISVPVPLADGRTGNLRIPKLLSSADASRIKAMVDALVMETAE